MVRTQSSPPRPNTNPRSSGTVANGDSRPTATASRTLHQPSHASLKSVPQSPPSHPPSHNSAPLSMAPNGLASSKRRANGRIGIPATAPAPPVSSRPKASTSEPADAAFESGAWLFDESRMPAWLAAQIQPTGRPTPVKAVKVAASMKQQQVALASTRQSATGQVIRLGSRPLRGQPADIGFDTGAWLFDETERPEWLSSVLRAPASPTTGRGRGTSSNRVATENVHAPPSPPPTAKKQRQSKEPPVSSEQRQPTATLPMSWAQVAASPSASPSRPFAPRPATKHRDPQSSSAKRSRSLPHRRTQRNPYHLVHPPASTTTAASTAQALDLPTASAIASSSLDGEHNAPPAAYTLHSSDPTYPLSLPAAHARLHALAYAHRVQDDCGPVAATSPAAERAREALHMKAARALVTFSILCVVLSVALAGLVARTGRPLVPANVGAKWLAYGMGVRGPGLVVGAPRRAREEHKRWVKVMEEAEGDAQAKVIYV